jgi:hypothetical protein
MVRHLCLAGIIAISLGCQQTSDSAHPETKPIQAAGLTPNSLPDFTRWTLEKTLQWDERETTCVAFSPDGRTIAVVLRMVSRDRLARD